MSATPPKVEPIAPHEWDTSLQPILADMNGAPIHVHQLMANNPTLLKAWWDFRNYSVTGGTLGKRAGELVILRVAVHMQAWYEWGSHVDRALACGLSIEEINRVLVRSTNEHWHDTDACILRSVDELIKNHCLSAQTQVELSKYFSSAQVMDIIAIHGMYVILACMIKSWGLTLDDSVQARIKEQASEHGFLLLAAQFKADQFNT